MQQNLRFREREGTQEEEIPNWFWMRLRRGEEQEGEECLSVGETKVCGEKPFFMETQKSELMLLWSLK